MGRPSPQIISRCGAAVSVPIAVALQSTPSSSICCFTCETCLRFSLVLFRFVSPFRRCPAANQSRFAASPSLPFPSPIASPSSVFVFPLGFALLIRLNCPPLPLWCVVNTTASDTTHRSLFIAPSLSLANAHPPDLFPSFQNVYSRRSTRIQISSIRISICPLGPALAVHAVSSIVPIRCLRRPSHRVNLSHPFLLLCFSLSLPTI